MSTPSALLLFELFNWAELFCYLQQGPAGEVLHLGNDDVVLPLAQCSTIFILTYPIDAFEVWSLGEGHTPSVL
ncbi:hypothetical protein B0H10DRAFT_786416 [Mycena sp. CBHHK59/15]|nr:hypothetical protein B0H10DRAFT_786416 [Mycena sp. CBHHK59/15]